jgi:PAS domain-containing protein
MSRAKPVTLTATTVIHRLRRFAAALRHDVSGGDAGCGDVKGGAAGGRGCMAAFLTKTMAASYRRSAVIASVCKMIETLQALSQEGAPKVGMCPVDRKDMRLLDPRGRKRDNRDTGPTAPADRAVPPVSDTPEWLADPRFSQGVLNSMQANVVVADADFTVLYVNPRAAETLRGLDAELYKAIGVHADHVVGADLTRLHEDPALLERQLRDPAFRSASALFRLGDITLGSHISRIADPHGVSLGYTVAWANITDKLATDRRAEAETREVSAVLETVAGASEELASTASEIARHASEASDTVAEAIASVQAANQTMVQLGEASGRINEIVKTITQVADQTNLLALNATIEAARAGEAGKGFAVVAGEVKELSKQTKAATERINEMIGQVQALSTAAIDAIAEISGIVGKVSDKQHAIASTVDQQTATTRDISANLAVAAERAKHIAEFVAGSRRG